MPVGHYPSYRYDSTRSDGLCPRCYHGNKHAMTSGTRHVKLREMHDADLVLTIDKDRYGGEESIEDYEVLVLRNGRPVENVVLRHYSAVRHSRAPEPRKLSPNRNRDQFYTPEEGEHIRMLPPPPETREKKMEKLHEWVDTYCTEADPPPAEEGDWGHSIIERVLRDTRMLEHLKTRPIHRRRFSDIYDPHRDTIPEGTIRGRPLSEEYAALTQRLCAAMGIPKEYVYGPDAVREEGTHVEFKTTKARSGDDVQGAAYGLSCSALDSADAMDKLRREIQKMAADPRHIPVLPTRDPQLRGTVSGSLKPGFFMMSYAMSEVCHWDEIGKNWLQVTLPEKMRRVYVGKPTHRDDRVEVSDGAWIEDRDRAGFYVAAPGSDLNRMYNVYIRPAHPEEAAKPDTLICPNCNPDNPVTLNRHTDVNKDGVVSCYRCGWKEDA